MPTALRVLMIEDSETDASLILRQLDRAGYVVESIRVETAAQLQSALEEKPWEIITADYSLPQFSTPAALEVLNRSGLDIPFIVISGEISDDCAVGLMKAGAQDYLLKDNLSRLAAVVERELIQARKRQKQLQTERALLQAYAQLEQRVAERTRDLEEANQALEKVARAKDEFLASMSHELRTPLAGILGLAEALQMVTYGALNDKQRHAISNIEISGRHLLTLINDILDLSKIEAGKFELQIEFCSLGDVCQSSLQLTRGLASQKKQKVSFSMEPASILLMADARRLKQMLVNLLGNAVKFTPNEGSLGVEVRGLAESHEVRISVWDTGVGIHEDDLPQLFKPFVQLDNSLTRQNTGTGLGLSLVESLAVLHGGRVQVESQPNIGSRFTLVLPWQIETGLMAPKLAPGTGPLIFQPEAQQVKPLVLMADDNEMVLELVSDFLVSRDYQVVTTHGGVEFLERLEQVRADMILMDIQMPGMDGVEVIKRIRAHPLARTAALPVIAVTALAMPGDRERCMSAGANAYLSKPVQLRELIVTIERLCPR